MSPRSVPIGEVRRFGDHALLIGRRDAQAARALIAAVDATGRSDIVEVVGGMATVMVSVEEGVDPDRLRPWVRGLVSAVDRSPDVAPGAGKLVTVPCVFDGPDLAEVAEVAEVADGQVGALVCASPLTVAVVGFSPGFAYLDGLPDALSRVPRRRSPRPVVPAGSVALANGHAAVYPFASPGGWHVIGRTAEPFFDALVPPYARLAPGDRVAFVAEREIADPGPPVVRSSSSPVSGDAPVFVVEQPGMRTVRQDGGRRGLASIGVPAAGPADPFSFELANRLVGNRPDASTLEVTAKGPTLRCLRPVLVAVVGARPDLRLQGQPAPSGQVVPVGAGQCLDVGVVRDGLRCYVAVAGGFIGTQLLGSSASDLLSGLGPGPIATGDHLAAGTVSPPLGDHVRDDVLAESRTGDAVPLRVVPGPHPERFAPGAFASLAGRRFTVGDHSNRIGVRLRPQGAALSLGEATQLDSQGMVTGAVQVPPDGHPVVLLSDHATLGGYPVVAVVATVDHGLLGQCAPGATVVLEPVSHAQSAQALAARRRRLGQAVIGHYPVVVE